MAYTDTIDGKTVDRTYSKVVNLLDPIPFVRSFKIIQHSSDKHTLTINQNRFIGTYPTQDAALGVLVGCALKAGGGESHESQTRVIKALNQMVTDGKGVFEGVPTQVLNLGIANGQHQVVSVSGPEVFCADLGTNRTWWNGTNPSKMRLWYGDYAQGFGASQVSTVENEFSDDSVEAAYLNKLSSSVTITNPTTNVSTTFNLGAPPTGGRQDRYVNSDVDLTGFDLSSSLWTVVITTQVVA